MAQEEKYKEDLQAHLASLEKKYNAVGAIPWSMYKTDPVLHQQKVVGVTQADFDSGTLRITTPCKIQLQGSVQFNPNRNYDWMPLAQDFINPNDEKALAYKRGFFAAIAVETVGVVIDLNGCTLEQHPAHALMQRFFTVIELGDQPFLPKEGPANFGGEYMAVNGTWIKNGTLGLTAHHGIHGNRAKNVLIENVKFKDYEVAAISLHGTFGLVIRNCQCLGTRKNVPVLGQFSAARFAVLFGKYIATIYKDTPPSLFAAYERLRLAILKVFNAVMNNLPWDDPELQIFKNTTGKVDGTAYGILIYPDGVAVNGHLENPDDMKKTSNIWIENVQIQDTVGCVIETPALARVDEPDKIQRGISGEAFLPFDRCIRPDGTYSGNLVANLQIQLQNLKNQLGSKPGTGEMFGRLSINPEIVKAWAFGGTSMTFARDENAVIVNGVRMKICYNGDVMHHVCKGVIGIRIEGADFITLKNVKVNRTENFGPLGQANVPYQGANDGGNKGQGQMKGYTGSLATGVCIAASKNITFDGLEIDGTFSHFGSATHFMVINNTTGINYVKPIKLGSQLTAGMAMAKPSAVLPNFHQVATPYIVGDSCEPPPEAAFIIQGAQILAK